MAKIGIIGGGSWGIAIAVLLYKNGHQITVWSALEPEITMLKEKHEHKMLPGVALPQDMVFTTQDRRFPRQTWRSCLGLPMRRKWEGGFPLPLW